MARTTPATTQDTAPGYLASLLSTRSCSQEWDSGVDHELLETLPAAEQARLRRFSVLDIPTDSTPEDVIEGVPTAELEMQTPEGQLTPLGEVFDEPEQFARSSESIEYVVVDDGESSRERVALAHELIESYDPSYYETNLVRAVESLLSPMGLDRSKIHRELTKTPLPELTAYGNTKND